MKFFLTILSVLFCFVSQADTTWLNRGQVYGPINVVSGTVYAAKGTGSNPVISGFKTVTLTSIGGNKWQSEPLSAKPEVVLINGSYKLPARYPNSGYLRYEGAGSNTITDNELSGNWVGAEVAIRKVEWVFDKGVVTGQSGKTLTYNNNSVDNGHSGWGYFLQNHINALDTEGEWCYSGGRLIVYSLTQPTAKCSQSSVLANGSGGTFINVDFEGASDIAVKGANKLIGCNISNTGSFGIYANSGTVVIDNCTFTNTGNVAVLITGGLNHIIRNSQITNTGIEGQGNGLNITSLEYSALSISGSTNVTVQGNSIVNTGYNAIHFMCNGLVKNNYVDRFNTVKDDGAGIYSWGNSAGIVIEGNIVVNGIGASATRNEPWYIPAYGIYMDDNVSNAAITGNTVAHCAASGIFIHNAYVLQITNNTVYNCGNSTADPASNGQIQFLSNGAAIRSVTMNGNKFVARTAPQWCLKWDTNLNDIPSFGTSDNNIYARPVNDNQMARNCTNTCLFQSLDQWKAYSKQDANSKKSPKAVNSPDSIRLEFNPTSSVKTISLPGTWVDLDNNKYTSITLQPYTSSVLLYQSSVTVTPPPPPVDTVIVTPPPIVPLAAKAGADFTRRVNEQVLLDGSKSTGAVKYLWSYVSGPCGNCIKIVDPASPKTEVLFTKGTYYFKLTVTDAAGKTKSDQVKVVVNCL